jgi:hypothetical protein
MKSWRARSGVHDAGDHGVVVALDPGEELLPAFSFRIPGSARTSSFTGGAVAGGLEGAEGGGALGSAWHGPGWVGGGSGVTDHPVSDSLTLVRGSGTSGPLAYRPEAGGEAGASRPG